MVKAEIVTEFHGEIEGVKFDHQELYAKTLFVMDVLESEYKGIVNNSLVRTFSEELWDFYIESDCFELAQIEKEVYPTEAPAIGDGYKQLKFAKTNFLIMKRKEQLNA